MIASTPEPPYYAVIFTSVRANDDPAYARMAERMVELASQQPGFLGVESARNEVGITVSYWTSEEAILNWKMHSEHQIAREFGKKEWYSAFTTRVAKVERDYSFKRS
jgi:heme-degrading monooxygenase HmoA